ncbi:hypothetical protein AB4Z39_10610 [Mycobacterium adipatum]|uniref:hypothetical protein n=1 Tax=Mycobacterium adipatum TaxID=1682113 RepID=UPI0034E0BF9B
MSAEIADEIEQQILPELQNAIVRAEVWGDYGPHCRVQEKLQDVANRLRAG